MLVSKASKRYALALIGRSQEDKILDEILSDVQMIRNTLKDSRDLANFLTSPIIKPDQKAEALKSVFNGKVHKLLADFLQLIAEKKRSGILIQILDSFVKQYEDVNGILNVDVRSAFELSDDQQKRLKEILEKSTGLKVNLHTFINAELKGGLSVKINDTVIDGTVKHKLEQLEDKFLANTGELI